MSDNLRKFVYDRSQIELFAKHVLEIQNLSSDSEEPYAFDACFVALLFFNPKKHELTCECDARAEATLDKKAEFFAHKPVYNADIDKFFWTLKSYETPAGCMQTQRHTQCDTCEKTKSVDLHPNMLGVYSSVNARSVGRGAYIAQAHYQQYMYTLATLNEQTEKHKKGREFVNWIFGTALGTMLNKSAHTKYLVVDIQPKEQKLIDSLELFLSTESQVIHSIIETRGGFHVIIDTSGFLKETKEKLWQFMQTAATGPEAEDMPYRVIVDALVPVPGTLQFGFEVKFYRAPETRAIEQIEDDANTTAALSVDTSTESTGKYAGVTFESA